MSKTRYLEQYMPDNIFQSYAVCVETGTLIFFYDGAGPIWSDKTENWVQ